jgi:hypothetical protein
MPQRYPEMTTHVHADISHRLITVIVEHDHGQSFSRAVIPKGRKAFRRWVSEHIMFGKLTEHHHILGGQYMPNDKTRCISLIRFGY